MQATTFFALFIGVFVVVHFLTLIAEKIRPVNRKRNVKTKRKNWYCFFSPNVFVGKSNVKDSVAQDDQQVSVRKRQVRHQQEKLRLHLKTLERPL